MDIPNRKRKLDRSIIQKLYHDVPSKDPTRESFLGRLKTFDVFNWSGKPIDPPQCAKHGWEIAEKDVLKCAKCHRFLSVVLPSPSKHESYKQACSKLKSRLTSAHSRFCLFSTNPLPESMLEIEHLSNAELQDTIQAQLIKFDKLESLCKLTRLQEEVKELCDWFIKTTGFPDVCLSSFTLVLTGWEFLKGENLLKCDYCNRKWSIEPYLLNQLATDKNESERLSADPVAQHQRWCAWRADTSGWESRLLQLQQLKESRSRDKRSRLSSDTYSSLTDDMRAVRKLLNGTL